MLSFSRTKIFRGLLSLLVHLHIRDMPRGSTILSMSGTRELVPTLSVELQSFPMSASDTGRLDCVLCEPLTVTFLGVTECFVLRWLVMKSAVDWYFSGPELSWLLFDPGLDWFLFDPELNWLLFDHELNWFLLGPELDWFFVGWTLNISSSLAMYFGTAGGMETGLLSPALICRCLSVVG
jgi:hypothetical protein